MGVYRPPNLVDPSGPDSMVVRSFESVDMLLQGNKNSKNTTVNSLIHENYFENP